MSLTDLELLNIDAKTGKPPEPSRLADVKAADSIYQTLRKADEKSSVNRARIQALFDGAAPYDSALLAATGQKNRTNLNFGEAGRYLDIATAGYVDLINAVETLVNVTATTGDPIDRDYIETVIAEEITRVIRDWPEFSGSYLRLVTEFIIHGVSVGIFRNASDFRFRVSGLGSFFLPRQTPSSEAAVEVACYRDEVLLHELYGFIADEKVATDKGWDVDEVKRVMVANATTAGPDGQTGTSMNWESLQSQIKNNDLYYGVCSNAVAVIYTLVREFDGTMSCTIHAENTPKKFLYSCKGRYEDPERAFVAFTNGVGTNGTFHSIRGLGQKIFSHVQVSNRLRSQAVDAAMLASCLMVQPQNQRALDELSMVTYGPMMVLSPNIDIVEKVIPNMSQSVMPVIADVSSEMQANLDFYSTSGASGGSPYRTKLQVQAELESATRLTAANLNLFYSSWRRLLREVTRRIINGDRSDKAVFDFYKRCSDRGVDAETIKKIDHAKTVAVKAIGAGNASARSAALNALEAIAPNLPEYGRTNLTFDRVATAVGYDQARRYAAPVDKVQDNYDAKMARMENTLLRMGQTVEVSDTDLQGTHIQIHAPEIQEILAGLEAGQIDEAKILPVLESFVPHFAAHTEYLSSDPNAGPLAASARELLANANAVLVNLMRQQQKQEREAAGTNPDAPDNPKIREQELKIREIELRIEEKRQSAESTERRKEMEFQQKLALNDAMSAGKLQAQAV